jgi:hypothetical protein
MAKRLIDLRAAAARSAAGVANAALIETPAATPARFGRALRPYDPARVK